MKILNPTGRWKEDESKKQKTPIYQHPDNEKCFDQRKKRK
jgi:hypothetical protein